MTESEEQFPEDLTIKPELFIDKTTLIVGPSGSGKSYFIKDILHCIRKKVPQIIVICPTDSSNKTYSGGMVRPPLIHSNLSEKLLITIWKRQEMYANLYARANQMSILEKLFKKLNLSNVNKCIDKIYMLKSSRIAEVQKEFPNRTEQKRKVDDINDEFNKVLQILYKRYISENKDFLAKQKLTPDERCALRYLDLNPRMVIVFDDCSADFKKIKTPEGKTILGKLFYQNRWALITVIIGIHDDKLLDSELRKNAYVTIFTRSTSSSSYFKRDTNGFPRSTSKLVEKWNPTIFQGDQKLVYLRNKDKFYKYTAEDHGEFTFGDDLIQEYCKLIEPNGITKDPSNHFFKYVEEYD